MKVTISIIRGIIVAILTVVVGFNVLLLVDQYIVKNNPPSVFGFTPLVVTTGSMEETIGAGDVIIIKEQQSYELGEIVSFRDSYENIVTHRIVGRNSGGFITKGDANNAEDDELLQADKIIGKVVLNIPKMGEILLFFKSPLGIMILLVIGFVLMELPRWTEVKKKGTRYRDAEK